MKIAIRADASQLCGTGHVMRCLTLAFALKKKNHSVVFLCREHDGHLANFIESCAIQVIRLPVVKKLELSQADHGYSSWLGCSWEEDVFDSRVALEKVDLKPNWLIVDNYALDYRWQSAMRDVAKRIFVIDDLAETQNDCDLLLDQNIENLTHQNYQNLIPDNAKLITGPSFALVRQEFGKLREQSLKRRDGALKRIMITLGGNDAKNDTAKVVRAFFERTKKNLYIDIVIGQQNPHSAELKDLCSQLPKAHLHIQTSEMAKLMLLADCAFTAGGSTTWERCVMGLPGLVTVQADNQKAIAAAMEKQKAQKNIGVSGNINTADYYDALETLSVATLREMSTNSARLCDGKGAERVVEILDRMQH